MVRTYKTEAKIKNNQEKSFSSLNLDLQWRSFKRDYTLMNNLNLRWEPL